MRSSRLLSINGTTMCLFRNTMSWQEKKREGRGVVRCESVFSWCLVAACNNQSNVSAALPCVQSANAVHRRPRLTGRHGAVLLASTTTAPLAADPRAVDHRISRLVTFRSTAAIASYAIQVDGISVGQLYSPVERSRLPRSIAMQCARSRRLRTDSVRYRRRIVAALPLQRLRLCRRRRKVPSSGVVRNVVDGRPGRRRAAWGDDGPPGRGGTEL